jgi:hypothetical protein
VPNTGSGGGGHGRDDTYGGYNANGSGAGATGIVLIRYEVAA